jgi:hypothetical protein
MMNEFLNVEIATPFYGMILCYTIDLYLCKFLLLIPVLSSDYTDLKKVDL